MPKLKCDWSHDLPGFRHFKSGRLPGWEIFWWDCGESQVGCCLLLAAGGVSAKADRLATGLQHCKRQVADNLWDILRTSWTCKLHRRIYHTEDDMVLFVCSLCSFMIRCYSLVSPKSLFGDKFGCWRALNTFNGPTLATWQKSSRMWLMEVRKL